MRQGQWRKLVFGTLTGSGGSLKFLLVVQQRRCWAERSANTKLHQCPFVNSQRSSVVLIEWSFEPCHISLLLVVPIVVGILKL